MPAASERARVGSGFQGAHRGNATTVRGGAISGVSRAGGRRGTSGNGGPAPSPPPRRDETRRVGARWAQNALGGATAITLPPTPVADPVAGLNLLPAHARIHYPNP